MAIATRTDAGASPGAGRLPVLALLALALVAAVLLARPAAAPSPGWDEATHVALPAARLALHARGGELDELIHVVLSCERYPWVTPLLVGGAELGLGVSEGVARGTIVALYALFLCALLALSRELARRAGEQGLAPLVLPLAVAASSPLALRHAGTLFLEVPFLCVSSLALLAWIRRRAELDLGAAARRELLAGALVSAAFFTKFNYGALFGAALLADLLFELPGRIEREGARRTLTRVALLAALPVLVLGWWFVLPLPAGAATAASHRAALLDFLGGNTSMGATPLAARVFYASLVGAGPWTFFLLVVLVLVSLARVARPWVRTLWLLLAALGLPALLHPFHLDRFWIPVLLPFALLAGVGARVTLERTPRLASGLGVGLLAGALLGLAAPGGMFGHVGLAGQLGLLSPRPEVRRNQIESIRALGLGGRPASAGLAAAEMDVLGGLLARAVAPGERPAWIGMSSEVPPASVHLALLARGGDRARFLSASWRPMDVTPVPGLPDPGWDDEALRTWAEAYDVVLATDPVDLKGRAGREWLRTNYQAPLAERLGWVGEPVGTFAVGRAPGEAPLEIRLWALRRPR